MGYTTAKEPSSLVEPPSQSIRSHSVTTSDHLARCASDVTHHAHFFRMVAEAVAAKTSPHTASAGAREKGYDHDSSSLSSQQRRIDGLHGRDQLRP